ncbi:MAG TPA: glycosyltransferase family 2 protein [Gammaproteobacteria bacterium]
MMLPNSMQSIRRVSAIVPTYRDADRAIECASRLYEQRLPAGTVLEVIAVDDGSGEGAAEALKRGLPADTRIVLLPENRGRSAARQAGLDCASGEVALFVDSDCQPTDDRYIERHLDRLMGEAAVASVGPVIGYDGRFWDRYQRSASARRRAMFEKGVVCSGSTQNMMVVTSSLRAAGGFDVRYRQYGFEDRDLLIRMAKLGRIVWCDEAVVRHLDRICMVSVSEKMAAAARENARLFSAEHPEEYKLLGYAAIDARERPWLRLLVPVCESWRLPVSRAFDTLERKRLLPWLVAFVLARTISAASYLAGTGSAEVASRDRFPPPSAQEGADVRTERS